MSMYKCAICEDIYDTDFQMEFDEIGNCICDKCFNENAAECDCCGKYKFCRDTVWNGMDTNVCHDCSDKPNK